MVEQSSFFTATLLNSGNVLVAGGYWESGASLQTARPYNPLTGAFGEIGVGLMTTPRICHVAALLDSGKVRLAGGEYTRRKNRATLVASADLFDPIAQTFSPSLGSMTKASENMPSIFIPITNRVLIAGGTFLNGANLYNPVSDSFTATGNMGNHRSSNGIGSSR